MSYLLDTNVVSETLRPNPNTNVISWLETSQGEDLYLSVLSLGEIRKGIELLDLGRRKTRLIGWLDHDLPDWFEERFLTVDRRVADRWGTISAQARLDGRALPAVDGLLAATALVNGLSMVTRNSEDFDLPGLDVVNPWEE